MEQYRNVIVLGCVAAYMVLCIAIGLWAMRRTRSAHDFFMAGRNLGVIVTGVAIFSSTLSGFGFVGGPALIYKMGISSVWMVICAAIGFCLSFFLLGKRIWLFAAMRKSVSLPDVVATRYKSELSRFLMAVAILLGVMAYLGSQIKAMSHVLQDIMSRGSFWQSMAPLDPWHQIGPIPTGNDAQEDLTDLFLETGIDHGKRYGKFKWQESPKLLDGEVHVLSGTDRAFYFHRRIQVPKNDSLFISLGSNENFKLWINGKLTAKNKSPPEVANEQKKITVLLQQGDSDLLLKVVNAETPGSLYFRANQSFPLVWCVVISSAVLVFYCVTGGIIASVYTDLFQGLIMIIAALLVFFYAYHALPGGFTTMSQTIAADDPESMSPWGALGMLGCLSWYFLFALGGVGQPHVITKMMMNKSARDVRFILPISVIGFGLSALLWISIGLAMRALVLGHDHPELATADAAAPQFLQSHTPALLAGVVFAALFAAIMSTADGFLNVGAAAVVHDIPHSLRGKSLKHELFWARITTVGLAAAAAIFSLYSPDEMIAMLGSFGWGIFAAAIVPVVAIGLNWKRGTALAANVAIISSLLINFTVMFMRKAEIPIPYKIHEGAIALLASTCIYFTISLLSKPQPLAKEVEAVMDV